METSQSLTKPFVTVLMTVYNVDKYIREALESVLNQTYRDFIFLIINDCSEDKSEEIILEYKDKRIRYYKNPKNLGLARALNKGLEMIDTKYFIRMDSDDISVPHRFEVLVKYMESHPEIGVFSSGLKRFGNDNSVWQFPEHDDDIKAYLLFGPSIAHAPSIIRTQVMKKNNIFYRDVYQHIEDYDLWYRLMKVTKFANTKEVLYMYRVATHNVTVMYSDTALERKKSIYRWVLESFGVIPTDEELLLHIVLNQKISKPDPEKVKKVRTWLNKLLETNKKNHYFPHQALVKQANLRWQRMFYTLPETSYKSVFTYIRLSGGIKPKQLYYLITFTMNKILGRKKA